MLFFVHTKEGQTWIFTSQAEALAFAVSLIHSALLAHASPAVKVWSVAATAIPIPT